MTPPILAAPPEDAPPKGKPRQRNKPRRTRRGALRILGYALAAALALPILPILAYRFVPPPLTPLMVIRAAEGAPIRKTWLPLARISPELVRAVVASEDEKFCFHHGFDWDELGQAWRTWRAGGEPRGASTISMQTAKNLFLWPGRSVIRKAIEAYLTALIELTWSKRRIVEVYLNEIEWGDGIYGAEMASRLELGKSAAQLTPNDAALLAAVLPNPRGWSPARPTPYIDERARLIGERMPEVTVPGMPGCR